MPDALLAINAGSSSVKFSLAHVDTDGNANRIISGELEGIETAPKMHAQGADGHIAAQFDWSTNDAPSYDVLLEKLIAWIEDHLGENRLIAVGHRVAHGGKSLTAPVLVIPAIMEALEALVPLAPLHQPHNLSPIRSIQMLRPNLPQVACFDTAFHHTQPPVATRFALPSDYEAAGVRRYGFHGLSYEYIVRELRKEAPQIAESRMIIAHLGNGASLCAVHEGRSLDTTMAFTALDGLVMGTRCGSIDPGVILYMQQQEGLSPKRIEQILYHESGLLGVSGISSDMRDLLATAETSAKEAVELFVYRVAREAAALTGSLGGLDTFVFTGGIGEHAAAIRGAVGERLAWLGMKIDPEANATPRGVISAANSKVTVFVVPTDEESIIHQHSLALVVHSLETRRIS